MKAQIIAGSIAAVVVTGNRILANEGILDGLGHICARSDQPPA